MDIRDLTTEQKARALECKTPEELVELAKEYGVELTDEQLDGIAGGSWDCSCDEPGGYSCNNVCESDLW